MKENLSPDQLASLYENQLLQNVIPFWTKHSLDKKHGGYFTCLDRNGNVYDTDKFVWLQGRQIYMFAKLYSEVEPKQKWLEIAKTGIEFLDKFGSDDQGRYYFSLDQTGKALTQPFNIFTDCFAALAYNEYAKVTGEEQAINKALKAFQNFLARRENPKGVYEKSTGARPLRSFGITMMTAHLAFEMESVIGRDRAEQLYNDCIEQILEKHLDPEVGLIREFIHKDGHALDTYEGRLINPGHGIEAIWFLLDVVQRMNRTELIDQLIEVCLRILDYSWDNEYGGIYYFMDIKGAPPQQLEHDQKLWWVHIEALIALSRAWLLTGRKDVIDWFFRVHEYTWQRFPDPEYGEWFGYLNREGKPHLTLKGGKWKGFFHVPRGLYECAENFKQIVAQGKNTSENLVK